MASKPQGLPANFYSTAETRSPRSDSMAEPAGQTMWRRTSTTLRFMKSLRIHLRGGGHAVIVIGNSIIQGIEFPVDRLLAQMAERNGLRVEDIHIVRTKRVGNS